MQFDIFTLTCSTFLSHTTIQKLVTASMAGGSKRLMEIYRWYQGLIDFLVTKLVGMTKSVLGRDAADIFALLDSFGA